MGILDIVFAVLVLVAVIIGLKRGFAKMITNFLCIITALLGSVVATILLVGLIQKLELFASFQQITSGWFAQEIMTTPVASAEELSALLSGESAGVFKAFQGIAPQLFDGMSKVAVVAIDTLGGYLGYLVATAIVGFVIWLVSYLILKYALLGIKKLLCLIAKVPVLRSIDKIMGVVWSVAFGYLVVIGVAYSAFIIVCGKFFPAGTEGALGETMLNMINNSTIFKYVHSTNLIGEFLSRLLQVDYTIIAPIVPVA